MKREKAELVQPGEALKDLTERGSLVQFNTKTHFQWVICPGVSVNFNSIWNSTTHYM